MHVDHQQAAGLSRRSFLKTSAMGGMLWRLVPLLPY